MGLKAAVLLLGVAVPFGAANAAPVVCAASDQQIAESARATAAMALKLARGRLVANDQKAKELLTRWYADNSVATHAAILSLLDRTAAWLAAAGFYCQYANDGSLVEMVATPSGTIAVDHAGATYAFVDPDDATRIYLGLRFFSAPDMGADSKFGTIIHEVTHYWLTGNTEDVAYTKTKCLALATQDPALARKNADSFQYFVEEASE